jgi:hypothetical protein
VTVALFLANVPLAGTELPVPGPLAFISDNAFIAVYWALLLLLPITFRRRNVATSEMRVVDGRVAARA